ncbi:uncharacterized protein VTP21DRAFT_3993 [Calcarisporiella thermophila]|uniref:uncharacterized protein n=1 Tax=Calcarisporiella thermophila TaxID=911321 RepID=UPI00374343E3
MYQPPIQYTHELHEYPRPAMDYAIADTSYLDLDERRRAALSEIDSARFSWFHVRACIVSGIGFFTDSYDLFAINLVSLMFGWVYFQENGNRTPSNIDTTIKISASIGTMIGQFLFGWLADKFGRKRMYGIELTIILIATIGQAVAGSSSTIPLWVIISFWRVVLGIGIGGDYPLSAVITSEFATTQRRGAMIAAVFAMQGLGILSASIVSVLVLLGYRDAIRRDVGVLDQCWRIVIGVGAIPAVVALYYRLTIPETPRYTMDVEQKISKGAKDAAAFLHKGAAAGDYEDQDLVEHSELPRASLRDFIKYFSRMENFKLLFGCASTWFLLDIAFYGIGLNNGFILDSIGFRAGTHSNEAYANLFSASVGNIIINLLGTVPGYWVCVFTIERLGRRNIQLMGFAMLTIIYVVMGATFYQLKTSSVAGFVVLFTLSQFFTNFGPNTTTFVVPGELFPTRYRSTCHGISAAFGKLGAIIAQVGFGEMKDIGGEGKFLDKLLLIFAGIMLLGFLCTFLITETKGRTLEELSNEDQTRFVVQRPKNMEMTMRSPYAP